MSIAQTLQSWPGGKIAVSCVLMAVSVLAAQGSSETLWNSEFPDGQWKAFGRGVLDSRALSNPPGLSILVDWDQATFGTGISYEQRDGVGVFPSIPTRGRLTFEARIVSEEGSGESELKVQAEWLERVGNGKDQAAPLVLRGTALREEGWVFCEFEFGSETPQFSRLAARINALRLVFPKVEQGGKSRVEVRKVELHGE